MATLGQPLGQTMHDMQLEYNDTYRSTLRTIRGKAKQIGWNMYQIPEGYGEYSGKIINTPDFQYAVQDDMMVERYSETYNFANDIEFASKLKAMYSINDRFRRTGRTRLQAQITVDLAIETGKPIHFVDHTEINGDGRTRDKCHHFMRQVEEIIDEYRRQGCDILVHHIRRDECMSLILRDNISSIVFDRIRIPTFNPEPVIHYVAGFDPYRLEPKDNLLLICEV